MERLGTIGWLVVTLSAGLLVTSCSTTYYKVRDPGTGTVYYTEEVERAGSVAMFKDTRSGAQVTIQNSEIMEISEKDYQAGVSAPAATTAPATTTAPEPTAAPDQSTLPEEKTN